MKQTLQKMIQAGVHFGHPKDQWNPKMLPYIYKEKNGIHIIDIIQTWFYLKKISKFLEEACSQGKQILFVGTKKQASKIVEAVALDSNSFFVNERWLGGLLTNWTTIQKSIQKLNNLQKQENFQKFSKKEKVKLEKQKQRLEKYIGGLKNIKKPPDIVIIIGQQKELNAVKECRKLGIRTITLLDTNCNPLLADLFVPANDDSIASIKLIINEFSKSIKKGMTIWEQKKNS
uniref:Small ribosomal subunit protein uS2c n=1 Tax=Lambia antarctica TaxID=101717 RepID=A0A1L2EDX0_9CHLO|nr:30S ribosomal protein S2 [Lambia antarctica]ANN39056.1 30S ribosomal protein S2 [Lambia antarctica]